MLESDLGARANCLQRKSIDEITIFVVRPKDEL